MGTKTQIVANKIDSVRAGLESSSFLEVLELVSWREAMKRAIRQGSDLLHILNLSQELQHSIQANPDFPVFVPREFLSRMEPGNPTDPLLLQVFAATEELEITNGFSDDPVGDSPATKSPGLIRKYNSRALLISAGACAIHCRYCFRRHFPYAASPRSVADWEPALAEIQQSPEIDEVILSGGDPLTLVDEHLAALAERIATIPHIQRLRIHTRLPIVIPQRVTDELICWLRGTRLAPIMVVHVNHANEVDVATAAALERLVNAGIPVLNQTVLLKGVNDSIATLVELSRKLVNLRVMPYYLHQLDRVRGAAHFEVPLARGLWLVQEMRKHLPGYAVPRYVQELAGDAHKRVLS